jgi:hypothetical protein
MEQPEGFRSWSSNAQVMCKLLKAVYGLKQAPFEWNSLLHKFLTDYGLHQLKCDNACYALITPTRVVYIAVYVDDVLIFSSDPEWTRQFKAAFAAAFDFKDMGNPIRVLGMSVVHDREKKTLLLHQGPYVRDLLTRFQLLDFSFTILKFRQQCLNHPTPTTSQSLRVSVTQSIPMSTLSPLEHLHLNAGQLRASVATATAT